MGYAINKITSAKTIWLQEIYINMRLGNKKFSTKIMNTSNKNLNLKFPKHSVVHVTKTAN